MFNGKRLSSFIDIYDRKTSKICSSTLEITCIRLSHVPYHTRARACAYHTRWIPRYVLKMRCTLRFLFNERLTKHKYVIDAIFDYYFLKIITKLRHFITLIHKICKNQFYALCRKNISMDVSQLYAISHKMSKLLKIFVNIQLYICRFWHIF